jgi:Hemerythrin HHE cation binding domain
VAGPDGGRSVAFSQQLRQVHHQLQDQLAQLRADPGRGDTTDLLAHCLAFCSVLSAHHSAEDDGLFGALLAARPDLAPAIGQLTDDHAAITAILRRVRLLAAQARTARAEELAVLRRELDGLAAIAESHFRYEERALSAALDQAAPAAGWPPAAFRLAPYD